ncbi:MAG: hypothetical protein WC712_02470 [Candidatus Brocadiia bacterium]
MDRKTPREGNSSASLPVLRSARADRFLLLCSLLVRIRRTVRSLLGLAAVVGVLLLLRYAFLPLAELPEMFLIAAFALLAAAIAFVWPIVQLQVESEADRSLGAQSVLSAYNSPSAKASSLYEAVVARAESVGGASPFSAIGLSPGIWLPLGVFGVILGLAGLVYARGAMTGPEALLARLARQATSTGEAIAKADPGANAPVPKEFLQLLQKIEDDLKAGRKAEAMAAIDTIRHALSPSGTEGAADIAKVLKEAGISPDMAALLAAGKLGEDPTAGSNVSANSLQEAAANLGSGALAASLAKASRAPAGTAEQWRAIYAASLVARQIIELDELRRKLDDRMRTSANGNAQPSPSGSVVSTGGKPIEITGDLREAALSSRYPIQYRALLIKYFAPQE